MESKTKKLFKWEGKKEIFWIVFIILILFASWGYYKDKKICKMILDNPCDYCYAYVQNQYATNLSIRPDYPFGFPLNFTLNESAQ